MKNTCPSCGHTWPTLRGYARVKAWRKANPEKIRAQKKRWNDKQRAKAELYPNPGITG